jgi:flagellar biosynthesis protein FlhA
LWISASKKEAAELAGYTVIDPESVFITHLSETIRRHAEELLTREDVQLLLDRLRKNQPSLVGEIVGTEGDVSIGLLQRVLRNLLSSGTPIRELTTILEALGESSGKTKNATVLTEVVRKALARTITEQYRNAAGKIAAITFHPTFEHQLTSALVQEGGELVLKIGTEIAMELNRKVADAWKAAMDQGRDKIVLLCDSRVRAPLARLLSRSVPMLAVVAYDEIVLGTEIEPVETLSSEPQEMTVMAGRNELATALAQT